MGTAGAGGMPGAMRAECEKVAPSLGRTGARRGAEALWDNQTALRALVIAILGMPPRGPRSLARVRRRGRPFDAAGRYDHDLSDG